jgi:phosphoenolpyruvate carboxykinase (ATP)
VSELTPAFGLDQQGIAVGAELFWNLGVAPLVEHAVSRGEGQLAKDGPLVVKTGAHTGRSANDKFIVRDAESESTVWWGKTNKGMTPEHFAALKEDFLAHLGTKDTLFIQDLFGGSQSAHRVNVRVINELAWHNLFIRTLLVRPTSEELSSFIPEFTIIDLPTFRADPARHGSRSETVIAVNLTEKLILIGGTKYAGEMKKSVFGILNYKLPVAGVMPMHCSANIGPNGDTAIFFGLSGTGKTTLSADASRTLIGDDEHGWSDEAVFNFEGGCYAKMIRLSPEAEPEIFATTKRFGTVLENVVMDEVTRELDFDDATLAENSRGSYPIEFIPNASKDNLGPVPKNMIFLTADAYGEAHPRSGDVPLSVGVHGARCRHRDRRHRTGCHLLDLLWRTVHAAAPVGLWQSAQVTDRQGRRRLLAGQYGLDRWPIWRRQPHADQGHPRAAQRGA